MLINFNYFMSCTEEHHKAHGRTIDEIDVTIGKIQTALGNVQEGINTFLVANISSSQPIEDMHAYLVNYADISEHLHNVGEEDRAKHFLKISIDSALDYHKRISEFLVRAFRDMSRYCRKEDPGKSLDLMQVSCNMVQHLAMVQGYALTGSGNAE